MIKNKAALFSVMLTLLSVISISDIPRSYGQTEFLPAIQMNMLTAILAKNKAQQLQNKDGRDFVFQKAEEILKEKFPKTNYAKYWQVEHNGFLRKFNINSRFNVPGLTRLIQQGDGYLLVKWDGKFEVIKYGFWSNNVVYSDKWTNWFK